MGKYQCPEWLFSSTFFALIAILAVFAVLLSVHIMENAEQQNCLAMLVFVRQLDRKSTRLNSSHSQISYAVFCLKKKKQDTSVSSRTAFTASSSDRRE